MTPVWVNGKFLKTHSKKSDAWTPAPKPEKEIWGSCECGETIYKGDSVGMRGDHLFVCCYTCWLRGEIPDIHLDGCDLRFPDVTLAQ